MDLRVNWRNVLGRAAVVVIVLSPLWLGMLWGWYHQKNQRQENIQQPSATSSVVQKTVIQKAAELKKENDKVRQLLRGYNVGFLSDELITAKNFLNRLEKNKKLASACFLAKANGVVIMFDNDFKIFSGVVSIDTRATDEEIIKFLTQ